MKHQHNGDEVQNIKSKLEYMLWDVMYLLRSVVKKEESIKNSLEEGEGTRIEGPCPSLQGSMVSFQS